MKQVLVFDVESIGLHGESYAVGGCILNAVTGETFDGFEFACAPECAYGYDSDRKWCSENIPPIEGFCRSPKGVRDKFWSFWRIAKAEYPDLVMAAECGWPVEANFLEACIKDDEEERRFQGPYPLHEIASFMEAAGMNPMDTYDRFPDELPKHDPLADAKQSARLLYEALKRIRTNSITTLP